MDDDPPSREDRTGGRPCDSGATGDYLRYTPEAPLSKARRSRRLAGSLFADAAFKGVSANTAGLAITLISQLLTVPLFLRTVGVQQYGAWLLLTSFSTYLSLGNVGFATAAGTRATGLVALGLREQAGQVIRSMWAGLSIFCGAAAVILTLSFAFALPTKLFTPLSYESAVIIIASQFLYIWMWVHASFVEAAFRAGAQYARGILWLHSLRLIDFIIIAGVLLATKSLVLVSVAVLFGRLVATCAYYRAGVRRLDWFRLGYRDIRWELVRQLAVKSFTYMGFSAGNAVSAEGYVLLVSATMGPTSVVIMVTVRTVANVLRQLTSMVNLGVTPEVTRAVVARDAARTRRLLLLSVAASVALAATACGLLTWIGPTVVRVWTANHVTPDRGFVFLMTFTVLADVPWMSLTMLLTALNQHQVAGVAYVLATALSLAVAGLALPAAGLSAVPVSLLLVDLVVTPVCFRRAKAGLRFARRGADIDKVLAEFEP